MGFQFTEDSTKRRREETKEKPCQQGVCHSHCDLAILHLKKYLKAKEDLWKLKYFTMQK
jgi:hypothetical protein